MEVSTFNCSICGESSSQICVHCTKDACTNHLCERCHRCSDCCACGMPVFSEQLIDHAANGHVPETLSTGEAPQLSES